MARFGEFDAAEMSLSSYVVGLTREAPFIAIPVFPSRLFRHSGIPLTALLELTRHPLLEDVKATTLTFLARYLKQAAAPMAGK